MTPTAVPERALADTSRAQRNEQLVRDAYEAFRRGDLGVVRDLFDPEIRWHIPGESRLSGDYVGIDQVLAFLISLWTETEGTLRLELHDVVSNDHHVVAIVTEHARRAGKTLSLRAAHVYRVSDRGQLAEFSALVENLAAGEAFWA